MQPQRAAIFALLLCLPLAASGQAQKKKPEIQEVKATGCVRKAVEAGCLLLRTLDGKTIYNIFTTTKPEPGTVITIDGKPHRGPTACMQGIPIDVSSWEPTGEKCSE